MIPADYRQVLAFGSQSVVLANGNKSVYIVTGQAVADNIERVRSKFRMGSYDSTLLVLPMRVAMNQNLAKLINPKSPQVARRYCREQSKNSLYQELSSQNYVYEMPRFAGTCENLISTGFKEDSIAHLESRLSKTLQLLHAKRLTHNDIALRNIFYTGTYPHLQFYLGDFGSSSFNTRLAHVQKSAEDLKTCQHVVGNAKKILSKKSQETPEKLRQLHEMLPVFAQIRRRKLGLSPRKHPERALKERVLSPIAKKLIFEG